MKKIIVAAVQISPVLYSKNKTVEKVVSKIRELGKRGVQFATFPESLVPYYPYFSFVQPPFLMGKEHQRLLEESVTVPSSETDAIAEAAKETSMVVSIGVNEREGGTIYNTQLLFDSGRNLIQRRRKTTPNLFGTYGVGSGRWVGPACCNSSVGRTRPACCWEHYNPFGAIRFDC